MGGPVERQVHGAGSCSDRGGAKSCSGDGDGETNIGGHTGGGAPCTTPLCATSREVEKTSAKHGLRSKIGGNHIANHKDTSEQL